jgi:hypothetical protein
MKYTFLLYAFVIVDLCIIIYVVGQRLHNLTCTEDYVQHNMGRRKYYLRLSDCFGVYVVTRKFAARLTPRPCCLRCGSFLKRALFRFKSA